MKKLVFLERDYECPDSDLDIRRCKRYLSRGGFSIEDIENMQIVYQYHLKEDKELVDLLFDKDTIKVAYSMYINGSDSDFLYFMAMAGKNKIKDVTYIDVSGQLVEFLNRNLIDDEDLTNIMLGISNNNIITFNYDIDSFKKLEIDLSNINSAECVVLKDFDINSL